MSDREWQAVALLLERAFKWREPFAGAHERAYRALLDGYSADQLGAAIRRLVAAGQVFGPTPGELVGVLERDDGAPTFVEAFELIYGRSGVLRARAGGGPFESEQAMLAAHDAAGLDRAWRLHPLLGAFAQAYGVGRLRRLEVDHDEHGALVRRDLQQEWERFAKASRHRDAAALAAGRRRELRRGPRQVNALAVLEGSSQGERSEDVSG